MSSRIHKRATRPSLRLLAGVLAALALTATALTLGAAPALAHDELVSSDPAAGATLESAPTQIVLTFNEDVLADEGATIVQVADASGTEVQTGAPVVSGPTVTQAVSIAAAPTTAYTVTWKIVSADGHPVSDAFTFTVAGTSPTPTATPTPTPTTTPQPTPSPTSTPAPAGDGGVPAWGWAIIAVLAVAVLGGILYLIVSRARQKAEDERLRASSAESEPPADR